MSKTQVNPKLFHCSKTEILAKNIANSFGADLGKIITSHYSDGEFQPSFEESIRGSRIFHNRIY